MNITFLRFTFLLMLAAGFFALPAFGQGKITELSAPKAIVPAGGPRVALETTLGRIVVELYPEKAPQTVANFLSYVRDGHYNGTVFHRVIADMLIQAGAFTPDLQPKPGRSAIANEANNGLSNLRGTLSAARRNSQTVSATAQFFINTVDNRQLDYRGEATPAMTGYCVFGRVLEGMEVVDRIRAVRTGPRPPFGADVPLSPVVIERALLVED